METGREIKRCPLCGQEKPVAEFYRDKNGNLSAYCHVCFVQKKTEYRHAKLEQYRAVNREWQRVYRTGARGIYYKLKSSIKRRGSVLNISADDFEVWFDQQKRICHYCQRQLANNGGRLDGLTFDRKDNEAGYDLENIVPCCKRCNFVKGSWFTEAQMLEIAAKYFVER